MAVKLTGKKERNLLLQFDKITDDRASVFFTSDIPAEFYDKTLEQKVKSPEGVSVNIEVPVSLVVELYLKIKTFEKSMNSKEDCVAFYAPNKKITFFKHLSNPDNLGVLGVDYSEKKAGIMYMNTLNYPFVLFLSYLQTVLEKFPILTYKVAGIDFVYDRKERLLTVIDKEVDKMHYIEVEQLNIMTQFLNLYYKENMLYTHSFTPDRNIYIDKNETFHVNDKKFDFTTFEQIAYLVQI